MSYVLLTTKEQKYSPASKPTTCQDQVMCEVEQSWDNHPCPKAATGL